MVAASNRSQKYEELIDSRLQYDRLPPQWVLGEGGEYEPVRWSQFFCESFFLYLYIGFYNSLKY